jgi:hypothetical protein
MTLPTSGGGTCWKTAPARSLPKPQDARAAAIDVGVALNMFRGMIDSGKLCRHDLLESAGGQLSETELTVPEAPGTGGGCR